MLFDTIVIYFQNWDIVLTNKEHFMLGWKPFIIVLIGVFFVNSGTSKK